MGITGLLPYLKKIHNPVNISKFEGCTVAIDAYCWLHKGAFSCADKIALGEDTDQYVYYCMKYVNCLLGKKLRPILVFDGCHLPSKGDVEKSRRERREVYRKKAAAFLREGKRTEAKECLQRCVDITPQMAVKLINACREKGVDCIVAPYEADAQLAFLSQSGIAQVIITEDSDLLPFGCDRIMFKMDFFGNGTLVEKSRLNEVLQIKSDCYTFEKFRHMCILSGCDYVPSLPGIGLAKANKVVKLARQPDLKIVLKKIPSYLKMKLVVTDEYIENFLQAENTFLHQLVYNPLARKLVPLVPYPPDLDPSTLHYAGPALPAEQAYQIALGNLNVSSKERMGNYNPDKPQPNNGQKKGQFKNHISIWDRNFRVQSKLSLKENVCENVSLFGKEKTVTASFLRKRSPVKRKREENVEELKTDSELVSMYDDVEPRKKQCLEGVGIVIEELKHDSEEETKPITLEISKESPTKACHKSPQKNRGMSVTAADVWEVTTINHAPVEKKVTPVKHNKFAVSSLSTRVKFNLNASKSEVRSRYFASSEQVTHSEEKCTKLEVENSSVMTSPSQTIKSPPCQTPSRSPTLSKTFSSTTKKNVRKTVSKSSGGSVFNWSKFASSTKTISTSKNTDEKEAQSIFSFSQTVKTESIEENVSDDRKPNTEVETGSPCSPETEGEVIRMSTEGGERNSIDLTLSPDNSLDAPVTPLVIPPGPKSNTSTPRLPQTPCRVSGLSRSIKKSQVVDKNGTQKSIKDMFSRFQYKR